MYAVVCGGLREGGLTHQVVKSGCVCASHAVCWTVHHLPNPSHQIQPKKVSVYGCRVSLRRVTGFFIPSSSFRARETMQGVSVKNSRN